MEVHQAVVIAPRPEDVRVSIDETSRREFTLPDGTITQRGQLLRDLISDLGGLRGQVEDPWGNSHEISLEPWADADPEETVLAVTFEVEKSAPPGPPGP